MPFTATTTALATTSRHLRHCSEKTQIHAAQKSRDRFKLFQECHNVRLHVMRLGEACRQHFEALPIELEEKIVLRARKYFSPTDRQCADLRMQATSTSALSAYIERSRRRTGFSLNMSIFQPGRESRRSYLCRSCNVRERNFEH